MRTCKLGHGLSEVANNNTERYRKHSIKIQDDKATAMTGGAYMTDSPPPPERQQSGFGTSGQAGFPDGGEETSRWYRGVTIQRRAVTIVQDEDDDK